jgi:DNA replication protein DnaC
LPDPGPSGRPKPTSVATGLSAAVPIVDRIIHHSHLYLLDGESYRLKQKTLS